MNADARVTDEMVTTLDRIIGERLPDIISDLRVVSDALPHLPPSHTPSVNAELVEALKAALRDSDFALEDGDPMRPWVEGAFAALARAEAQSDDWHDQLERDYALVAEAQPAPLQGVIAEIAAERQRQVEVEGWTGAHDDTHRRGELAKAASCYAYPQSHADPRISVPVGWPWAAEWWKPGADWRWHPTRSRSGGRRRDLVKAGALIVAEIERLDRAAGKRVAAPSLPQPVSPVPASADGGLVERLRAKIEEWDRDGWREERCAAELRDLLAEHGGQGDGR